MPLKTRPQLKSEFENGDIPDQDDFADTIDSALNLVEDGLYPYRNITSVGTAKNIGIGDTAPTATLGLTGQIGQDDRMISFTSLDEAQKWNINLNPSTGDVDGFSIDDATSGPGTSRFFINHVSPGNIGMGNVNPQTNLHVTGANIGANVSIMVENAESGVDQGWLVSAVNDTVISQRAKAFAIHEKTGSQLDERITILSSGDPGNPTNNVGVNEMVPRTTFHVTKPFANPTEQVALIENTGILCLGQIDNDNLAFDSSRIQARHGDYSIPASPTLVLTTNELSLQPLGGGLRINGDSGIPAEIVTVGSDGKIGVGASSTEKVTVKGAVVFGDTNTAVPPDGAVRWSVSDDDLQVWKDAQWNSLTTHTNTDGIWTDAGGGTIYYNPIGEHPKVGIGISQPNAMLHVKETNTEATGSTGSVAVINQASTLNADPSLVRIGLGINCSGVWSPNPAALNIGLYIPNVTGQTADSSNIAALINGNTVIGNITGNTIVGDDAVNVLAIQNGHAPSTIPGLTETTGIQMYSDNVEATAIDPGFSALHLMTGDGAVMKFYRQPDMTSADINMPNTGNAVTDALIVNMRTRIDELETILKTLGLLTP